MVESLSFIKTRIVFCILRRSSEMSLFGWSKVAQLLCDETKLVVIAKTITECLQFVQKKATENVQFTKMPTEKEIERTSSTKTADIPFRR